MSINIGKYVPQLNEKKSRWDVVDITTNEVVASFNLGSGRAEESAIAYANKLSGN